jgi:hypothetical protein
MIRLKCDANAANWSGFPPPPECQMWVALRTTASTTTGSLTGVICVSKGWDPPEKLKLDPPLPGHVCADQG